MLVGAGVALALVAMPPAAAHGDAAAHMPGEVIVAHEGGGSSVVGLEPGASVGKAIAELRREPGVRAAAPNWVARAALVPFDQGTAGTTGGWAADQWSLRGRPGGIRVAGRMGPARGGSACRAASGSRSPWSTRASPTRTPPASAPAPTSSGRSSSPVSTSSTTTRNRSTSTATVPTSPSTIGEQITVGQPAAYPDYLAGIAYGASLMPVRVLDEDGVGSTDDVAAGIEWAAVNGADVINLSLNLDPAVDSCREAPTICDAIRKADKLGALVVGSAGNAIDGPGRKRALFPAGAPRAFAAAATTEHGCLAGYSYYGKRTDLVAPGGGTPRPAASRPECDDDAIPILQLSYACFPTDCSRDRHTFAIRPDIGTSMSAAHTSAVAALVIASGVSGIDPAPARVALRLQCTARPAKPERFYSAGLLDAKRAVAAGDTCDA